MAGPDRPMLYYGNMITANFCARLLKATGFAQILITHRERPAGVSAGEDAALQAQLERNPIKLNPGGIPKSVRN